jgi:4a-hydroxytetrahydrobiopterin dehydratase
MRVKKYKQFKESSSSVNGWNYEGKSLRRSFQFEDFSQAWGFVKKVMEFAVEVDHHPKILNDFNKVEIWLTSHDEGGVTERDISLAEEINKIKI